MVERVPGFGGSGLTFSSLRRLAAYVDKILRTVIKERGGTR
jgi:hypothetical protein